MCHARGFVFVQSKFWAGYWYVCYNLSAKSLIKHEITCKRKRIVDSNYCYKYGSIECDFFFVLTGVSCDSCSTGNFRGKRFKCLICYDYDLCATCYENGATTTRHTADHPMQCILTRTDFGKSIFSNMTDCNNVVH